MPHKDDHDAEFAGRVAFITGAGRGQGESHALRLAELGANVAIVDLGDGGNVAAPPYSTATSAQIQSVADRARNLGCRAIVLEADVRSAAAMVNAARRTVEEFGRIDYVIANAGITDRFAATWEIPPERWQTMLDINLTGVFHTVTATRSCPDGARIARIEACQACPRGTGSERRGIRA